jgi:HNH endonuclease
MKLTPSQVKNLMRRGLLFLIDAEPEPQDRKRCIAFFAYRCAYCGAKIDADKGDLDHLLSSAKGGRNHISNRVFSCKPCNAQEKQDKAWEAFLLEKHGPGSAFQQRRSRILSWVAEAGAVPPLAEGTLLVLEEQANKVTAAYEEACIEVRKAQQTLGSV